MFAVPRTALLLTGRMQVYIPARDDAAASPVAVAAITAARAASAGSLTSDAVASGSLTGSFHASSNNSYSNSGDDQRSALPPATAASANILSEKSAPGVLWSELPSPSVTRHKQSAVADTQVLVAPAELPPGEYLCVTESILLQVPWGPSIPSYQQTATYQAQVLSKGSIDVGSRGGSTTGGSSGDLTDLAKLSSKVLSRISKGLMRANSSDSVPSMPHLQTALDKMRQERAAAGFHNLRKRSREVLGSRSLHTLYEAPAHEPEPISRLKKPSAGSVSTPTYASGHRAATAAGATAGQGGDQHVAGDIEMGAAAAGAGDGQGWQQAGKAAEDGKGTRTAAADGGAPAAVLPRALDALGQLRGAAVRSSRSFKHSSLQ